MGAADRPREVAISGATGFLGSALCRHLVSHGYRVRGLARVPGRAPDLEGVVWHECRLPDLIDESAFSGPLDALVHCAFETRFAGAERGRAINVEGSRRLFECARKQGVARIVFISSMSAHENAISLYGRSKLEVETLLDPARDVAIRPGHIVGEGGVFWRTAQSIAALPFIPVFFGGRQRIQTVCLDDVCEAIRRALERELFGVLQVAEPEAVPLREFYALMATHLGKTPRFIPFPGGLVLAVLRIAERLGFQLPMSSDNLLGLKHLEVFDVAPDLRRLGMTVREMRDSVSKVDWGRLA